MVLLWKHLLEPPNDSAACKQSTYQSDTDARHQAGEAKHHSKRENDRPRSVRRHLDSLDIVTFQILLVCHSSPSNEIYNRKHNDPDSVDKVPIERNRSKALTLTGVQPPE